MTHLNCWNVTGEWMCPYKLQKNTAVKEGSKISTCMKMAVNRLQQGQWWF